MVTLVYPDEVADVERVLVQERTLPPRLTPDLLHLYPTHGLEVPLGEFCRLSPEVDQYLLQVLQ